MSDQSDNNQNGGTEKRALSIIPFLFVIALLIIIICFSFNHLQSWITGLTMPNNAASFGAQFGFLSTLFSGLAFAVLISTIFQQRDSIKAQQSEIEKTQESLKKQAELQLKQIEQQHRSNQDEVVRSVYKQIQQFENSIRQITIRFIKEIDVKTKEVRSWEIKKGELASQEIYKLARIEITKLISVVENNDRDILLIRGHFFNFLSRLDNYQHKIKELSHIFRRIDSVPDLSEEHKKELFDYAIDILPEYERKIFNLQYQRAGYRERLPEYVKEQFGRREAYNQLSYDLHTSYVEVVQAVFLSLVYERWQDFTEEQKEDIHLRIRGVAIFRKGAGKRWEETLASLP